jgi:hypothetical protein
MGVSDSSSMKKEEDESTRSRRVCVMPCNGESQFSGCRKDRE